MQTGREDPDFEVLKERMNRTLSILHTDLADMRTQDIKLFQQLMLIRQTIDVLERHRGGRARSSGSLTLPEEEVTSPQQQGPRHGLLMRVQSMPAGHRTALSSEEYEEEEEEEEEDDDSMTQSVESLEDCDACSAELEDENRDVLMPFAQHRRSPQTAYLKPRDPSYDVIHTKLPPGPGDTHTKLPSNLTKSDFEKFIKSWQSPTQDSKELDNKEALTASRVLKKPQRSATFHGLPSIEATYEYRLKRKIMPAGVKGQRPTEEYEVFL